MAPFWIPSLSLTVVLIPVLLSVVAVNADSGSTRRLISDLTYRSGYSKHVRSSNEKRTPTEVEITFWPSAVSVDEDKQVIETSLILESHWYDPALKWDPTEYGDVDHLVLPQNEVWLPDLTIENAVGVQNTVGYGDDNPKVVLMNTGKVQWYRSQRVSTGCKVDVSFYPFDVQECKVYVSTGYWKQTDVKLSLNPSRKVVLTEDNKNIKWKIEKASVDKDDQSITTSRDYMRLTLTLRRSRALHIVTFVGLVLLLAFTASVPFILPTGAGEKMGTSVTVLLIYVVYLAIAMNNIPTNQVSLLAVYLLLLLGVDVLGVILSAIIIRMRHIPNTTPVGNGTKQTIGSLQNVFKLDGHHGASGDKKQDALMVEDGDKGAKNAHVNESQDQTPGPRNEEITWVEVSVTIDRLCFILFTALVAFITFLLILTFIIYCALH